jgi:hypothetical protein
MWTPEWGIRDKQSVANTGIWVEGTWIDKVDKMISMPLFNLDLGFHFEMFMTVPGIWFGAPPISLGIWPSLIAAVLTG